MNGSSSLTTVRTVWTGYRYGTLVLPSSSPANAILSFDQKLRLWRDILT